MVSLHITISMFGIITCITRVTDHRHHVSDVIAGIVIGVVVAIIMVNSDPINKIKNIFYYYF